MVRILNTKQVKELDVFTIKEEGIPSIDLMERACLAFVNWLVQRIDGTKKITVVCGTGNNGGDGLGIARLLHDWNYRIEVLIVRGHAPESGDFKINLKRLADKVKTTEITGECSSKLFSDCDVIIDAIFGSGLSRAPEGIYAQVIKCMNETSSTIVSVDIPSGLSADGPSAGPIVEADYTVTFQLPKLSFFLPQSYRYTGEWQVVDIGLSKTFIRACPTDTFLISRKDIRKMIKPRMKFDHKGKYGHALVVGGSFGKMGAVVLACRAVLRTGAGLVTAHVPGCGYTIVQTSLPEAMVSVDLNEKHFTSLPDLENFTTIGIGPGLGREADSAKALKALFAAYRKPVVIDADGLNLLSEDAELLNALPENSVLTPHPKEFERLVGSWSNDFERLEKQKQLASKLNSVIVVKGAFTSIASADGRLFFNSTGNPAMAKGGSGDVLTGIITSLLSQGYPSLEAAQIGVYLHGLAGDLGSVEMGKYSLLASDLVEIIPQSFRTILT